MFESLLERIATALDAEAIPYMVIGGQAVLVHGEPRLTRDIDITLGVDIDQLGQVLAVTWPAVCGWAGRMFASRPSRT